MTRRKRGEMTWVMTMLLWTVCRSRVSSALKSSPVRSVVSSSSASAVKIESKTDWSRVVAIGDMHGDMNALLSCLRVAGVVDTGGNWISEPGTCLVSCGDILDRGDDDWQILKYLSRLQRKARSREGDVALVLGNHECFNVMGDMFFVSKKAMLSTARDLVKSDAMSLDDATAIRISAFQPGGEAALMLAELCGNFPVARIVQNVLFCHGGLHLSTLDKYEETNMSYAEKLAKLNHETAAWLRGSVPQPKSLTSGCHSPVWSRAYSNPSGSEPSMKYCDEAREVLNAFNCKHMVVGHTPQITSGINGCCSDTVYRIDTGASAFYGGKKEALEFRAGQSQPRILSPNVRFDVF